MFGKKEKLAYGLVLIASFFFFLSWEGSLDALLENPASLFQFFKKDEQATILERPSPILIVESKSRPGVPVMPVREVSTVKELGQRSSQVSKADETPTGLRASLPAFVAESASRRAVPVTPFVRDVSAVEKSDQRPSQILPSEPSLEISSSPTSDQPSERVAVSSIPSPTLPAERLSSAPLLVKSLSEKVDAPGEAESVGTPQSVDGENSDEAESVGTPQSVDGENSGEAESVGTPQSVDGEGDDTETETTADKIFRLKVSLPRYQVQGMISAIEISLRWNESLVRPTNPDSVCYDTSGSTMSMQGHVVASSVKRVFLYPAGIELPLDLMTCRFQTLANVDGHENLGVSVFEIKISDYDGRPVSYALDQARVDVSF